ncbi:MAG: hypothetical protein CM15mP74_37020 [Halieaceae bacterium]|nr:MAG: hypothetical protein CM15mP74_37020 [Halieaceae bacterium]
MARGGALDSEWIGECDGDFKHWLDRYKYADRHPEHTAEDYRKTPKPSSRNWKISCRALTGWVVSQPMPSMWRCFRLFGSLQVSTPRGGSRRPTLTSGSGWRMAEQRVVLSNNGQVSALGIRSAGERFPPNPDHSAPANIK